MVKDEREMEEEEVIVAQHLHSAGETLPELTEELLSAHTTQFSEIAEKEQVLSRLEAELAAAEEQLLAVSGAVAGVLRRVCLQEDQEAGLGSQCGELEREVGALVLEKEQLLLNHRNAMKEKELQESLSKQYEEKMKIYQDKTKDLEQLSPTQIEIENLKGKISALKVKSKLFSHLF